MNENSRDKVVQALERLGIPIVAFLYAMTVAVQIGNAFDKLGWRLTSILILLLSIGWAVYVWTAKRPNVVEPDHLMQKYGRVVRLLALAAVIISFVPAWFSILPTGPKVPPLLMSVRNTSDHTIHLSQFGEAFFSVLDSPFSDSQVAACRIRVSTSRGNDSLAVPSRDSIWLAVQFLNENDLVPWLERGDVAVRVIVTTTDGYIMQREGIPFTKDYILSGYYQLEYK